MAKSRPLVSQHLEQVSSALLEKHQKTIREFVRGRHGIYALYRNERLYYVGLASNLRTRLKAHFKDRHKGLWNRFSIYLTIDAGHIRELESLVLRIVRTDGNRTRGRLRRSQDLKKVLRREVKLRQRMELVDLFGGLTLSQARPVPGVRRVATNSQRVSLAPYARTAFAIRGRFRGKLYQARVRRDGTIRWNGRIFQSPSDAAEIVVGGPRNGWTFWNYERAPGDWVEIANLRR